MIARRTVLTIVPHVFALGASVSIVAAQPAPASAPLSVEEVLKLSQAGVSEEVIVTKIKKNGKPFDLSTDEILELRKSGVSDTVIRFLEDPSLPYSPPPPPAPPPKPPEPPPAPSPPPKAAPAKKYPEDDYAARVPSDPGLYNFPQDAPVKVEIKALLGEQSGAGLGKIVLKKSKVIAYLVGPTAKVRVAEGAPVFYIRLPEGKAIEDLLLVALDPKNGRRELDVGPPGPKPQMKPEALRQFDSLEVGPALYRLNPVKLAKGEFMFYLNGSAEPPKGNYGKGYEFGAGPPPKEKR